MLKESDKAIDEVNESYQIVLMRCYHFSFVCEITTDNTSPIGGHHEKRKVDESPFFNPPSNSFLLSRGEAMD